jgi:pimeloyl-ACP methyl ester carboxylesterase
VRAARHCHREPTNTDPIDWKGSCPGSDPTIVLVHGAFADASGFRGLYDELLGEGVTMIAPPNPLRGLTGGDGE